VLACCLLRLPVRATDEPAWFPCCRDADSESLYNAPAGHREVMSNYRRHVAAKRAQLRSQGAVNARLSYADPVACFEILPVSVLLPQWSCAVLCWCAVDAAAASRRGLALTPVAPARRPPTAKPRWARTSSGRAASRCC
jgi:hypothetical protein